MTIWSDENPQEVPYERKPRIPLAFEGVQVNYCKTPSCRNFGIPVDPFMNRMGRVGKNIQTDHYAIAGYGKGYGKGKCLSFTRHT